MKTKSIALILATLTAFSSCSRNNKISEKNPGADFSDEETNTIGFSIDTLAIERWRRDCDIFMSTVKDCGAEVIVQNAGNSTEEQIKQIQYLISRKVNTIVIVPKDAESLSDVIKLSRAHNIPVISYDRLILNSDINLYITIDSEETGRLMAQQLSKTRSYGNWYCIYGSETDYNMTMIRKGVEETIKGLPINIGFIYYTAGWNYDLSYKAMVDCLKRGGTPDAVICGNDAIANSVIQAISEYAPKQNIAVAGQDADIAGCQNIVNGKQAVTVYKPITELAQKTAIAAFRMSLGATAEEAAGTTRTINNGYGNIPVLWLKPEVVTKENLDEVIIKSGFHTEGEVYRR